jgi:glycosyltransferase involved in cell wall biosynthesis
MLEGPGIVDLEIVVVCNGCSDNTASIARSFGNPVRVIESAVPSKSNALNLGDAAALGFPRFYVDADIVFNRADLAKVATALEGKEILAAAPRPQDVFLEGTSWAVKAYYRAFSALPYIQEGMIAAGVYALSKQGRARFGNFPDVIADDGYVRLLFSPYERAEVPDAISYVRAPLTLTDLLKIRTRSRLGVIQLKSLYPDLVRREIRTKNYFQSVLLFLARPALYIPAIVYAYVVVVARHRAKLLASQLASYKWVRDESSRIDT